MPEIAHDALHHAILSGFVDRGTSPTCADLAAHFGVSSRAAAEALAALQEYHGVVLHPDRPEVWVAHPFSTAPTGFTVRSGDRIWWGNCAWCSLGLASLVAASGDRVVITTTLGGEDEQVTLVIEDGVLTEDQYVVHFPVPMVNAWDNVIYTCSVMLLFRDEDQVDDWCERRAIQRGDIQPAGTVLAFAAEWYGRHLDRDWRKWTAEEAAAIFARHGLSGEIWELPVSTERF